MVDLHSYLVNNCRECGLLFRRHVRELETMADSLCFDCAIQAMVGHLCSAVILNSQSVDITVRGVPDTFRMVARACDPPCWYGLTLNGQVRVLPTMIEYQACEHSVSESCVSGSNVN